ncbi:MAG: 1-acyl-sn-glycerol-3-phosphate acyltransferase [Planctomycetota bacterium]|nr:MAG: 1-acyl-sn-glycerol-3-phosphate acyltransferase [Planctomycetota bacterium]
MFKKKLKARWFWLARWICRVFCILFVRLRVCGRENVPGKGAVILLSNHQSYLDPVLCGVPLKRHLYFLARDNLFDNRLFGLLLSSVNTIPVKRGQADLSAMRKVTSKLKEGCGLCLFPEGTRSNNGKIAPFRPGFGLLAKRGQAAIVPVVIDGAFEFWPRHKKIFSIGVTIVINYGKAITAEHLRKMSDKHLAKYLTDTLRQMQNNCRLKQGKEVYRY